MLNKLKNRFVKWLFKDVHIERLEIGEHTVAIDGNNITLPGTVDGVDLSAHAANASAHHAKTTSFADLTDRWTLAQAHRGAANKIMVFKGPAADPVEEDKPPVGDIGLSYYGKVTTYTDTTHFKSSDLTGFGDDFFVGYFVYVVRDADGASAAPQQQWRRITDYASSDGTFNHEAFTTPLAVDDEILIMHPDIEPRSSVASNDVLAAADTERSTAALSYTKVKEIRVRQGGSFRFTWDRKCTTAAKCRIYRNGAAVGTEFSQGGTSYVEASDDVAGWSPGDLAQLYMYTVDASYPIYCRNFRIKGTLVSGGTVLMD